MDYDSDDDDWSPPTYLSLLTQAFDNSLSNTTLFLLVTPPVIVALYRALQASRSRTSLVSRAKKFDTVRLGLAYLLLITSTATLASWFLTQDYLKPVTGLQYAGYFYASPPRAGILLMEGYIYIEWETNYRVLLASSLGIVVSVWDFRTLLYSVSTHVSISAHDVPEQVLTKVQGASLSRTVEYLILLICALSLAIVGTHQTYSDIRDVSDDFCTRTGRVYEHLRDKTTIKRCPVELGACHVLKWHGMGEDDPVMACREAVSAQSNTVQPKPLSNSNNRRKGCGGVLALCCCRWLGLHFGKFGGFGDVSQGLALHLAIDSDRTNAFVGHESRPILGSTASDIGSHSSKAATFAP